MFKVIATLVRGRGADAAQGFVDANALTILRQQLRDAADGLEKAKRSVAVVMAYCEREKASAGRIAGQIADLEARALEALRRERDDLATEAAAAIAELEAEKNANARAIDHYEREIARLRGQVGLSEQRLRATQRGYQLAEAAAKTHKLRGTLPDGVIASLKEAEATLDRLQERHEVAEEVELAMVELSAGSTAEAMSARLAAAGCGAPLRSQTAQVLARLRANLAEPN